MEKQNKGTYTLRRLFPFISKESLNLIEENSSLIKLKKKQNLYLSGDFTKAAYGLANGCLKIMRENQEGNSLLIQIVHPGTLVGIREIFGEMKYNSTAIALKDCEIFIFEKDFLISILQKNSQLTFQFLSTLSHELNRLEKRLEANLYKPAKSRVASVLFYLAQNFCTNNSKTFHPILNRKEIAEYADVTPETVSRTIAHYKNLNILKTNGGLFTILDMNSLQSEAEES